MTERRELEARVAELEDEVARLRRGHRGVRRRSPVEIFGLPAFDVAMGPDPDKGETRGHARGFVAVGDIATGVFAVGGWARGVVALGGLATGLVTLGGLSVGLLAAFGGGAVGGIALGGGAVGGVAIGGGAVGYYACGGQAAGRHVASVSRQDPEAVDFFDQPFLAELCPFRLHAGVPDRPGKPGRAIGRSSRRAAGR